MSTTRRVVIGGAGALVLAGAGLGYRAWDRGLFEAGEGDAFRAWENWRGHPGDGSRQPLRAAILAANPHDTQPWLFQAAGDSITVLADRSRNLGSFDPFRREMHLGVGCAIENLMRAASVYGYSMNVIIHGGRLTPSPKNDPVRAAHLWLDAGRATRDPLFEAIPHRHTNRGPYLERPVSQKTLLHLIALTSDNEVQVVFITDTIARNELAATIMAATERIIADPEMSGDSARWFRTGKREVEEHRDGIGIDTAGLTPLMAMGAKMLPDQDAATADQYWLRMTRDIQTVAPVFGLILVRDRLEMGSAIAAGRAWQRLHLAATSMGLAAQPLNQPVECVDRNAQLGRNDAFAHTLKRFAHSHDWEATFCFRLGYAEREALPSPRRRLSDVMVNNA
jgi:nitroreductase